jgi:hypothetical protein
MSSEAVVLSHWHQSIEGLSITPSEFYAAVKAAVEARNIPGVWIGKASTAEGAVFSAEREYLRVKRGDYYFDICGAPFANGSFVSYWFTQDEGCLRGCLSIIPILGWMLLVFIFRETFYKVDTRLMFQGAIHSAILEVVDGMMQAKGLRALSAEERKPTITKLLK